MNKPVIVVGYRGSMGKRYTKILEHLGVPWFGIEAMGLHYDGQMNEYVSSLGVREYHSVIICTPTATHMDIIKKYRNLNLPMLCEKPVSFNLEDLDWIVNNNINLRMVNQYEHLSGVGGATYYDYYNTGQDGLKWDCINIIGLAGQERAKINNTSPVWTCRVNGRSLTLADIDGAYIEMIRLWLDKQDTNHDYMLKAHTRVTEGYYEEGTFRDSGEIDKRETTGEGSNEHQRQDDARQGDISVSEDGKLHRGQKQSPSKRSSSNTPRRSKARKLQDAGAGS